MEAVIDNRIKKLFQSHDLLNGFHAGRGTGTTIMDLKKEQELASVDQDPLFLVLLDLRKE